MAAECFPRFRFLALATCAAAAGSGLGSSGCSPALDARRGAIVSDGAYCPDGYDFPRTLEQCTDAATATGFFNATMQEQDASADLELGSGGVLCAVALAEAGCRTVFVPDGRCSGPDSDGVRALCVPAADAFQCEPGPPRPRSCRPLVCGPPAPEPTGASGLDEDTEARAESGAVGEPGGAAEASEAAADAEAEAGSNSSCAASASGPNSSGDPGSECAPAEELTQAPCKLPEHWCDHYGGEYSEVDCDDDGILDPFCQDNASSQSRGMFSGYLSSKDSCTNTYPFGTCNGTCAVPLLWCMGNGDVFQMKDCDFDGRLDPYCASPSAGHFIVSSASNCSNVQLPGECSSQRLKGPCPRPSWWCTGEGAAYHEMDCDKDGVPDPYCAQGALSGYLSSASECWDSWPTGGCNGSCPHPDGWCQEPQEHYSERDCDGDGILDPQCSGPQGTFFLSSNAGCQSQSECLVDLPAGSCPRPPFFCAGAAGKYSRQDCDFDGIPDPFCHGEANTTGFVSSSSGCTSTWPHGLCNGTCFRPPGWCMDKTDRLLLKDCDGDGKLDLYCLRKLKQSWLVSSEANCTAKPLPLGCPENCTRPEGWCTGPGDNFTWEDLDRDSKPDGICRRPGQDYPIGLLSMHGCEETSFANGHCWVNAKLCNILRGPGGIQYQQDCDGDGRLDTVCAGRGRNPPIYMSSAHSCHSVPFRFTCRSPWTPRSLMQNMQCSDENGQCPITMGFCGFGNLTKVDVDGDGIEDWTCTWTGVLSLKRCGVISSRYGCMYLWRANCSNITADLADRCIPDSLSRLSYRWYAIQKEAACSMKLMTRSVGRQGRVLLRTIIVRAVASAGLFLLLWLLVRCLLKCCIRPWPCEPSGEGAGVWALQLVSLLCHAAAGVWACLCVSLDYELRRTFAFQSAMRDTLAMMEALPESGVLQDASVIMPFTVGCLAAELLLMRCWPEEERSGVLAVSRSLHCLVRIAAWPQLQNKNWAVRYAVLQVAGDTADALEATSWLLHRSPWHFSAGVTLALRIAASVVLQIAPCLATMRSLWLHPPHLHLWRLGGDADDEGLPLAGSELVWLDIGCFLPPTLTFLRAGLHLAAPRRRR